MSKVAELALNLLVAVCTFIVLMVLGWTVRKVKSIFARNKSDQPVELAGIGIDPS